MKNNQFFNASLPLIGVSDSVDNESSGTRTVSETFALASASNSTPGVTAFSGTVVSETPALGLMEFGEFLSRFSAKKI